MPIGKIIITNDTGEQVEAKACHCLCKSFNRYSWPFMPSGSSTAWLKGIVLGIIRSTRKMICVQKLQGGDFLDKKPKADSPIPS